MFGKGFTAGRSTRYQKIYISHRVILSRERGRREKEMEKR